MAKRRLSGDGMVRKRDDGRWEGRVVVGYDDKGLPITKSVLAKTKDECVDNSRWMFPSTAKEDSPLNPATVRKRLQTAKTFPPKHRSPPSSPTRARYENPDHLWEGRYSPKVNGKRMAQNVYAQTEAECEEKLAALIV